MENVLKYIEKAFFEKKIILNVSAGLSFTGGSVTMSQGTILAVSYDLEMVLKGDN